MNRVLLVLPRSVFAFLNRGVGRTSPYWAPEEPSARAETPRRARQCACPARSAVTGSRASLANRADTYNLGDILGDHEDAFKVSFVENCLTSNSVLNKLASKSQKDVYAASW